MKFLLLAATLLALTTISSCKNKKSGELTKHAETETPDFDAQAARSLIDSLNAKFSEKIASGDSVALASYYWPDAELLLDNSEVVKGPEIMGTWGAVLRMGLKEMNFTTTDIKGSSHFIIETGGYEMKGENQSLIDRGKYVVIWEKRNNEWKLYRDIGCTSLPLPK